MVHLITSSRPRPFRHAEEGEITYSRNPRVGLPSRIFRRMRSSDLHSAGSYDAVVKSSCSLVPLMTICLEPIKLVMSLPHTNRHLILL